MKEKKTMNILVLTSTE